ncbi:MAG: hypothetical protein PHQ19_04440 [Candidatus Krumholzibacteria bacterium]|nr:hypothetical protein [Candidatus Krumholzibacteria bacterium]
MCVFTHFAAGALAGSFLPVPVAAPLLGLGSHLLLDVIPHRDFEDYRIEILLWLAAMAALGVMGGMTLPIALAGLFAVLPDLENLLWKLGRLRDDQKIFPGHRPGWLRHGRETGRSSIVLQIVFTVVVVAFLIRRSS